jgi:hypothetical protein
MGRKKGHKRRPCCPATETNNGSVREKVESSDQEFVASAGRDFKRCTRPPKGHFEKVLEAACPHHLYSIKHKLRDCTMMKRFMSSDTPTDDDELARDLGGKGMALVEAKVTTIIG